VNQRQRVKDLVELAVDEGTPDKERLAAALKAVTLIHKHDLLASPFDGLLDNSNETIQAATDIFSRLTDPDFVKSVKKVGSRFRRIRRGR
jgi:hypothetical protein